MTGAYQFLKKYGVAIGFGAGTIITILSYVIILSGFPEFNPSEKELYDLGIFDFALYSTYFLMFVAILLVAGFTLAYTIKNPKDSVKGLIAFGVLAALFLITYMMGDGTLTADLVNSDPSLLPASSKLEEGVTQSSDLQFVDGLIKFSYILMLGAGGSMLFAMGRDMMKQS